MEQERNRHEQPSVSCHHRLLPRSIACHLLLSSPLCLLPPPPICCHLPLPVTFFCCHLFVCCPHLPFPVTFFCRHRPFAVRRVTHSGTDQGRVCGEDIQAQGHRVRSCIGLCTLAAALLHALVWRLLHARLVGPMWNPCGWRGACGFVVVGGRGRPAGRGHALGGDGGGGGRGGASVLAKGACASLLFSRCSPHKELIVHLCLRWGYASGPTRQRVCLSLNPRDPSQPL